VKISFIQPSRNNLKYLKWSYDSIRKNQGDHDVEICVADDFSNDGTWEWCQEIAAKDKKFRAVRNNGPSRLGHTILYDKLINEVATNDIAIIYHADMYLCPGALDAIEKNIKPGTIVSLTRIEPPLHPSGPEKITRDFGTEPEEFNEKALLEDLPSHTLYIKDKTTEGIFAPWAFYRKDFQEIGGHDPLYAPQSKEDSDIFNRFLLNGIEFVQTWEGFVYHMTCRGSRFNPTLTQVGKESDEWLAQNQRSSRNFIRKWGHFVMHDRLMKPIVPPKYSIGLVLFNSSFEPLFHLEPWFSKVWVDNPIIEEYIEKEQKNTKFDLNKRVYTYLELYDTDIIVRLDANKLNETTFNIITQLSQIIEDSGEVGTFTLEGLQIEIKALHQYQDTLIHL